ncbi:MAG: hypothetical protein ACHP9V_05935 [Terriglobales bacterium]
MIGQDQIAKRFVRLALVIFTCGGFCLGSDAPGSSATSKLPDLLQRMGEQMSEYLDRFSDVRCAERVVQEKFRNGKDKIDLKEESTYDYLVMLSNTGGELNLSESRLPVHEAKADKKNRSMLVSNGFATLFLVFHPLYSNSFEFSTLGEEVVNGHRLTKVAFRHIRGTRTPAAMALRGREYPLELSGTAWIDTDTSAIARISAGIDNTMVDVGLNTLQTDVEFAPVPFHDPEKTYWFPSRAVVEVETPRQHWRNTHEFTHYQRFSVNTEEQVLHQ